MDNNNLNSGVVECIAADSGNPGLSLSGLQLGPHEDQGSGSAAEEGEPGAADVHSGGRLQWLPDFDLADMAKLFTSQTTDKNVTRMQDELTLLYIIETPEKVEGLTPCQPHFAKFWDWLHKQRDRARAGKYTLVEDDCAAYIVLPREERVAMLENRYQTLITQIKRP